MKLLDAESTHILLEVDWSVSNPEVVNTRDVEKLQLTHAICQEFSPWPQIICCTPKHVFPFVIKQ